MTDLEVEKSEVKLPVVGANSAGMNKAKKIGLFVAGLCLCVLVGVGIGFLTKWLVADVLSGYPASEHDSDLSELNKSASMVSFEEAKLIYEDAISDADTDLRRNKIMIEYGRYLIGALYFNDGKEQLDLVNDDILNAGYKILLYSAYRDYYEFIGDVEKVNEYNDKVGEVVSNSDFAAGGGA